MVNTAVPATVRGHRQRGRAFAVMVAALGVTLAACSSGSSATTSTTGSGASTPDRTAMAAVLLRASDFPAGWAETSKAQSTASDAETKKLAQTITACRSFVVQADVEKKHVNRNSATFADSAMPADSANEASNQVVGYGTEEQAKTAYAVFAGSDTGTCLQQVFDKMLNQQVASLNAQGGPAATVSAQVQRLGVPSAGDATTAYQIVVSIDVAGTSQQIGFIVQIVRLNQYVVSYNATMYQAAPDKFGENLVDRSMARFEAALGSTGS